MLASLLLMRLRNCSDSTSTIGGLCQALVTIVAQDVDMLVFLPRRECQFVQLPALSLHETMTLTLPFAAATNGVFLFILNEKRCFELCPQRNGRNLRSYMCYGKYGWRQECETLVWEIIASTSAARARRRRDGVER